MLPRTLQIPSVRLGPFPFRYPVTTKAKGLENPVLHPGKANLLPGHRHPHLRKPLTPRCASEEKAWDCSRPLGKLPTGSVASALTVSPPL